MKLHPPLLSSPLLDKNLELYTDLYLRSFREAQTQTKNPNFNPFIPMARTRPGVAPGRQAIGCFTIAGTNKVVRVGDCVLMRPYEAGKASYVARVDKLEVDARHNVKVRCQWYYRPEESAGGRRQFHGVKELFLSDHYDVQSADTIEGKCVVHTFKSYTKLERVGPEDFYCRFAYKAGNGAFSPDRVAVYCKCEMPYNPDELMVQCDECKDWYHPVCVGTTIEEAKLLEHFLCAECSSDYGVEVPHNEVASLYFDELNVEAKRRRTG